MNISYLYIQRKAAKAILIFSALMLIWVAGCFQNYGRINWDENVTQAFENNQVYHNYNFYQYTIGMQVFAIIGLDPKLELQSNIWRELSSDTEDFKVATSRIWYNDTAVPENPRGAIIRNPSGEGVGVYYSSLRFVSIDFKPNNRVMVMLDTTPITGGGPSDRRPH